MPIQCEKCGARVASRAALPGHYRKAHPRTRQRRPGRVQNKGMDISPIQSQIVPYGRGSAPARPVRERVGTLTEAEIITRFGVVRSARSVQARPASNGDGPPSWWEPQASEDWRGDQWAAFPADYRNRILAQRAGAAFTIRAPRAADATILWSQYHALKALATRLDAGIATERERGAFVAGLREYNVNYDRIAQRQFLLER